MRSVNTDNEFLRKSELQRISTPVENWKARGGFEDEFECPAGTGAKLASTALS